MHNDATIRTETQTNLDPKKPRKTLTNELRATLWLKTVRLFSMGHSGDIIAYAEVLFKSYSCIIKYKHILYIYIPFMGFLSNIIILTLSVCISASHFSSSFVQLLLYYFWPCLQHISSHPSQPFRSLVFLALKPFFINFLSPFLLGYYFLYMLYYWVIRQTLWSKPRYLLLMSRKGVGAACSGMPTGRNVGSNPQHLGWESITLTTRSCPKRQKNNNKWQI